MIPAAAAPRSDTGFTLLEVLGAVLIFVAAFAVLVGTSGELIQRVSATEIRLEASEIAERELAQLETSLAQQQKPPADRLEEGEDFTIRMWSEPAIDDLGGGGTPGGDGGGMSALVGSGLIGPTIAREAPGLENFILRYEIRVEWGDFDPPDFVRRTTYAFDWEGARQALPDLFTEAGSDGIPSILDDPSAAGGSVQELIDQIEGAR
ncbi:MAG: hypothetical protein CL931_15240 [Deltaproteobacteria bacterium]|nr:hypothetical protein [Deltaproteobacteria bacterium]